MTQEEIYQAKEKSAKAFLDTYCRFHKGRVGIDVRSSLGSAEPYLLYWTKKRDMAFRVPYHVTWREIDKLGSNYGAGIVYGRTPWGPWCELKIFRYSVVRCIVLEGRELRSVKQIKEEELNV